MFDLYNCSIHPFARNDFIEPLFLFWTSISSSAKLDHFVPLLEDVVIQTPSTKTVSEVEPFDMKLMKSIFCQIGEKRKFSILDEQCIVKVSTGSVNNVKDAKSESHLPKKLKVPTCHIPLCKDLTGNKQVGSIGNVAKKTASPVILKKKVGKNIGVKSITSYYKKSSPSSTLVKDETSNQEPSVLIGEKAHQKINVDHVIASECTINHLPEVEVKYPMTDIS